MTRPDQQVGSATVFGVAVIGLVAVLGTALISMTAAVAVRIETETAADAAALAAVAAAIDGRAPGLAATSAASANGAHLVRCRCPVFASEAFSATVLVSRDVRIPVFGRLQIVIERSAEYSIDP